MADPTNPNDPDYSKSPNHVFVGGRWQYAPNKNTEAQKPGQGYIRATSLGTGDPFAPALNTSLANMNDVAAWGKLGAANSARQQATNPYSEQVANQSRQAQMALMSQMRAQQAGPSLAALQGQRAMGQLGQQAIGNAAMGGSGRGAMLQAGQMGAGMAGDVAQGRLAEIIRSQASLGGMAGGMRGTALGAAEQQQRAGLAAQALQDQMARHYASLGSRADIAIRANALEELKRRKRQDLSIQKQDQQTVDKSLDSMATVASMGAGGK